MSHKSSRTICFNCRMFLRNCWYVIAWDYEVPADGLFARTVLNEPIVVFRTAGARPL
jgi:vanillate O-demethylase monooxygenase subunit